MSRPCAGEEAALSSLATQCDGGGLHARQPTQPDAMTATTESFQQRQQSTSCCSAIESDSAGLSAADTEQRDHDDAISDL